MTIRLTTLLALFAFTAPALASSHPQPLGVGDVRTYHNSSAFGALQAVRTEVEQTSGPWYRFDSFIGLSSQWVAYRGDALFVWDAGAGRAVRLFDFAAQPGTSWPVDFSRQFGAGATMTLAANDETVRTGAGTFDDCRRFTFQTPPGVADAGWGSIWFAPGVGVVKWTQNSFAGPVVYALQTASVGGITYPQPIVTGGLSVSLETDRYEYVFPALAPVANIYATATLTITNATGTPIDLTFGSGQTFDIELIDSSGRVAWIWSANKSFIQVVTQQQLTGTMTLSDSIPLPAADEDYTVKMYLTTIGGRSFAGSAPIRVRVR